MELLLAGPTNAREEREPSPIGRGWLRSSRVRGCGRASARTLAPPHPSTSATPSPYGRRDALARRLRSRLREHFSRLPEAVQDADPSPLGRAGSRSLRRATARFVLPAHRFGNVAIGIQPARGYNIDPKATYHDPDLVPPHSYFAFYFWLREEFGADALIHMGKHGNLEWLPGKALALSENCFPEAALGPLPVIYPFIVNDPGEGAQAKRRTAAVVVDHLMPPMARAESYGPAAEIEALIDEYAAAEAGDPRRAKAGRGADRRSRRRRMASTATSAST